MPSQFTDVEILTIYLWTILQKQYTKKDVYKYAVNYLFEYFPNIPSYQAFNNRFNNLHEAFRELVCILTSIFTNKFSTAISRLRQPIESLFNQIDEKVNIQNASKVRFLKGVLIHVCGKLTVFVLEFSNIFVM